MDILHEDEQHKKGKVFNLQSFSTSDGPGIRTVVFFQGCNMRCVWCHNPESQPAEALEAFQSEKCIGCQACMDSEEYVCYAGARTKNCRDFTPQELWKLLEADIPYLINSGGGITFSGGECMLQADFLAEMVGICRKHNIHTAVDTAGHLPYDWLTKVNPDLFLYDIKASSPVLHKKLTGVDGTLVWENLEKLVKDNYPIHVRIPCVPAANWHELPQIAQRLHNIGITSNASIASDTPASADTASNTTTIELLPYHRLGEGKAAWFGKEAKIFNTPSEEEMKEAWNVFNFLKT